MAKLKTSDRESRAAYWRQVSEDWSRSGLTQVAFCRQRRISLPSLQWWRCELKRRRDVSGRSKPAQIAARGDRLSPKRRRRTQAHFTPVTLLPSTGLLTQSWEVVLTNGRTIRVPRGFDGEELARAISILEPASC
jgi:hypothetical protein